MAVWLLFHIRSVVIIEYSKTLVVLILCCSAHLWMLNISGSLCRESIWTCWAGNAACLCCVDIYVGEGRVTFVVLEFCLLWINSDGAWKHLGGSLMMMWCCLCIIPPPPMTNLFPVGAGGNE